MRFRRTAAGSRSGSWCLWALLVLQAWCPTIALAAEIGLPLATTSTEIAEVARGHAPAVLVL